GFIDIHSHGDLEPLAVPGAESKLRNGVTTEICGNCGSTPFPLNGTVPGYLREKAERFGLKVDWQTTEEYFDRLEAAGCAINRLFLVGHGRLRGNVVGTEARLSTAQDRAEMAAMLDQAMFAGAWGLSSGLMYAPGCYADEQELTELCRVVAAHDGFYSTHLRSEGAEIFEAIDEAVRVARNSSVRLQISHLKLSGQENWRHLDKLRTVLTKARDNGINLSADWYPYEAWNANLDSLLPNWVYEGGTMRLLSRLRNPNLRKTLAREINDLSEHGICWEKIFVASVSLEEHQHFQGKAISEIAAALGLSPEETLFNIILAEGGRAEGFIHTMSEEVQRVIFSWPFVSVGSDATAREFSGPSAEGFPHPRSYGTHARVLRRVREENLLPLEEAIRRMSSLPAEQIGLADRGILREGMAADLVIFDPEKVEDTATYQKPVAKPRGIIHVLVNGEFALRDCTPTGNYPGKLLRK
ncbi:MAG: amidohydrolase family protein, partial [Planctomycetes bacterium]|nr:amidohydrolase family protein [Planctomycetota bacterium]